MIERRIGAFGGTFDPIHNGHLQVAREVARIFKLDRMLLIPAHRPPHKDARAISDAYHRYAMAVVATLNEPALLVSAVELEAPDKPYTFETIERLKSLYGNDVELFFVMGADSFREVDTWREPVRVLEGANWIVVTRPGHVIGLSHLAERLRTRVIDLRGVEEPRLEDISTPEGRSSIFLTDSVSEDISSTAIRWRVKEGRGAAGMVPEAVATFIERYGLYRQ
ncbi:MAG TPA: nicotinate-nucleotide adenylyltransferase [Blastocatellia bacterium]|nr:nicotinate-nucleotide adenylyltransferase [Blastocatellia bacterium]